MPARYRAGSDRRRPQRAREADARRERGGALNRFGASRVTGPLDPSARTPPAAAPLRTPTNRIIQGVPLSGGAALPAVTAGADRIPFYWTPLILGLTYLLAAAVDGPRGGYWATALVLTGWGLAVVLIGHVQRRDIDTSGAYLAGAGLAGLPRLC